MALGAMFRTSTRDAALMSWYYLAFGIFLSIYVPKIIFVLFHFAEDILMFFKWLYKIIFNYSSNQRRQENTITRAKFLSYTGIVLASIPFASMVYGMAKGRFNFKVERVKLNFNNLPQSFKGLRIVQISDIHIGSFDGNYNEFKKAISLINDQNADIMFFTGDMVNNFAEEMNGWVELLSTIKARIGKYSILGNHDYGNYYHWNSEQEKALNFERIKEYQKKMGFKMLNNEAITLSSANGEKIAIIGVENWGHPPFPQYADYEKAVQNVKDVPFKILLTHDPSHWDAVIKGKTDVAFTLSGHTHGMQFGVKLGKKEWSPAQYKYPHWAGLYNQNNQYLYVNKGLGYIGYPGRVGMWPEITVFDIY
jgi:predicted MPP superfamily phosphohydrolase